MFLLAVIVLVATVGSLWFIESMIGKSIDRSKCSGVKLVGPMYSVQASGTIADAFTFVRVRGIQYARTYFVPFNPQTASQTAQRLAMSLSVAYWQTLGASEKDKWRVIASGEKFTGFNRMIERALEEYTIQIGVPTNPVSVSYVGEPGVEVWTWT